MVETRRLESVRASTGTGGSNPSLSATAKFNHYWGLLDFPQSHSRDVLSAFYPNLSQCEYNGPRNRCTEAVDRERLPPKQVRWLGLPRDGWSRTSLDQAKSVELHRI